MRKTFIIVLVIVTLAGLTLADVIIGPENIDLTDREIKQMFSAIKLQARAQEASSTTALKIEAWLETGRAFAQSQGDHDKIDQAILVTRIIRRRQEKAIADAPITARLIKQATIDTEVIAKQRVVDNKTEIRDNLVASGAPQEEIDIANIILAEAETQLTTAQAVTVEDFIITP